MNSRCITVVLLLSAPMLACASDDAVYESFSGVKIGRVFLSPADREALDRRRLNPPVRESDAHKSAAGSEQAQRSRASAGYIISASGRARVWRDGDFVVSDRRQPQKMAFPGDVKITRRAASPQTPPPADANPAATEDRRLRGAESDVR